MRVPNIGIIQKRFPLLSREFVAETLALTPILYISGMAGIGDTFGTCFGPLSRWSLRLAQSPICCTGAGISHSYIKCLMNLELLSYRLEFVELSGFANQQTGYHFSTLSMISHLSLSLAWTWTWTATPKESKLWHSARKGRNCWIYFGINVSNKTWRILQLFSVVEEHLCLSI